MIVFFDQNYKKITLQASNQRMLTNSIKMMETDNSRKYQLINTFLTQRCSNFLSAICDNSDHALNLLVTLVPKSTDKKEAAVIEIKELQDTVESYSVHL